jgi:hypothetical protein
MKKEMKLKEILECIKIDLNCGIDEVNLGISKEECKKVEEVINSIFDVEVEDRLFSLEDVRIDKGIVYNKLVDYNKNEVIIFNDLGMLWYEYSLEDYIRDICERELGIDCNEVNKYVYEDYNEEDYI